MCVSASPSAVKIVRMKSVFFGTCKFLSFSCLCKKISYWRLATYLWRKCYDHFGSRYSKMRTLLSATICSKTFFNSHMTLLLESSLVSWNLFLSFAKVVTKVLSEPIKQQIFHVQLDLSPVNLNPRRCFQARVP